MASFSLNNMLFLSVLKIQSELPPDFKVIFQLDGDLNCVFLIEYQQSIVAQTPKSPHTAFVYLDFRVNTSKILEIPDKTLLSKIVDVVGKLNRILYDEQFELNYHNEWDHLSNHIIQNQQSKS